MAELSELVKKRKEFEANIITKALGDKAFRKALIENPKAVFEQETGKSLPEGLSVQIIEEDANAVKLVLPKVPESVELKEELSEEALETIAGGVAVDVVAVSGSTGVYVSVIA